jgi:hypothetical protein
MTAVDPAVAAPDLDPPEHGDDDSLVHWTCCEHGDRPYPRRAFCGAWAGQEAPEDEPTDCVVCHDLDEGWRAGGDCPVLGRPCSIPLADR